MHRFRFQALTAFAISDVACAACFSCRRARSKRHYVPDTIEYDLKLLLGKLVEAQPNIEAVYIFGSRAYQTGSPRSDCDLLIKVKEGTNVKPCVLHNFATENCPALDFFLAVGGQARSCENDSFVYATSLEALIERLDAIALWSKEKGFFEISFPWTFSANAFVRFIPTNLPNGELSILSWHALTRRAEQEGLPVSPYIGDTVDKAAAMIADVARSMLRKPSDLLQRGNASSGWTVNLQSEYDCQNLFYTVVKPWLPGLAWGPPTIIYDGQKKICDFSLFDGKLLIEMKYIDTEDKKREVVKTLEGLNRFYSQNTNVRCIMNFIYYKPCVNIDRHKWEHDFTFFHSAPRILTYLLPLPPA
jgi:hypothetical protein